jgi:TPR repeat protein
MGRGGVMKDENESLRWYRSAASLGCPRGQSNLASCYAYGQGMKGHLHMKHTHHITKTITN